MCKRNNIFYLDVVVGNTIKFYTVFHKMSFIFHTAVKVDCIVIRVKDKLPISFFHYIYYYCYDQKDSIVFLLIGIDSPG